MMRLLLALIWAAAGKAASGGGKPSRRGSILAAIETGVSIADRPEYLSVLRRAGHTAWDRLVDRRSAPPRPAGQLSLVRSDDRCESLASRVDRPAITACCAAAPSLGGTTGIAPVDRGWLGSSYAPPQGARVRLGSEPRAAVGTDRVRFAVRRHRCRRRWLPACGLPVAGRYALASRVPHGLARARARRLAVTAMT